MNPSALPEREEQNELSVTEAKELIAIQKLLTFITTTRKAIPFLGGGTVGALLALGTSYLTEEPILGPVIPPQHQQVFLILLGTICGSTIIGGAVKLASAVASDRTLNHYAKAAEGWVKLRLGRMTREQYELFVSASDYHHLFSGLPENGRPELSTYLDAGNPKQRKRGSKSKKRRAIQPPSERLNDSEALHNPLGGVSNQASASASASNNPHPQGRTGVTRGHS